MMVDLNVSINDYLLDAGPLDDAELWLVTDKQVNAFKLSIPVFDEGELITVRLCLAACHDMLDVSSAAILIPGHLLSSELERQKAIVTLIASREQIYPRLWVRHSDFGWVMRPSVTLPLGEEWCDALLGIDTVSSPVIHEKVRRLLEADNVIFLH